MLDNYPFGATLHGSHEKLPYVLAASAQRREGEILLFPAARVILEVDQGNFAFMVAQK